MTPLQELNSLLRKEITGSYTPPLWSRLYICLTNPRKWINRLAVGRVVILLGESRSGELSDVREFLHASVNLAWRSQFKRCPWLKFK